MNQIDLINLKVPVEDKESGQSVLEDWKPEGQSDGSTWSIPKNLTPEGHEHYFKIKDPGDREARCECGLGGAIYPHNAKLIDGHIYTLEGNKVI